LCENVDMTANSQRET